jgi:hypothetical protein
VTALKHIVLVVQRISDELAECFDSGDGGARMTALLVSPFGTTVCHVQVGRDADGAFLGRGWPEFVEAHGISVGWFLVLRHEGRGVLTVKAFDGTCFIKEFGKTLTGAYFLSPLFLSLSSSFGLSVCIHLGSSTRPGKKN